MNVCKCGCGGTTNSTWCRGHWLRVNDRSSIIKKRNASSYLNAQKNITSNTIIPVKRGKSIKQINSILKKINKELSK